MLTLSEISERFGSKWEGGFVWARDISLPTFSSESAAFLKGKNQEIVIAGNRGKNPVHVAVSWPEVSQLRRRAMEEIIETAIPSDAKSVAGKAVPDGHHKCWYGVANDGSIYAYRPDSAGGLEFLFVIPRGKWERKIPGAVAADLGLK